MNLLWPMDPPWIKNRCLEYHYTKLGRWTYFGQWTWQISWQMYTPPIMYQLIWMAKFQMFTIRAHLGRSPGWWTPQMHHGIYIMGCIWQPYCILQEKVGISYVFLNNYGSKQSVSIVQSCQIYSPLTSQTPMKHPQNTPTWQLQISTMRPHICQV